MVHGRRQRGSLGTAAYQNIGNSGATVPLCNGGNVWGEAQQFSFINLLGGGASLSWNASRVGFYTGTSSSVITAIGGILGAELWGNAYQDTGGTSRYITNGPAAYADLNDENFQVFVAASGTAGSPVTFIQAFEVSTDGGLTAGSPTGGSKGLGDSERRSVVSARHGDLVAVRCGWRCCDCSIERRVIATSAASTAQSNAETFATSAASTAQSNAESFATSADTVVLSSAETYAASQAAAAQAAAEAASCQRASNLSDVASASSARTNLGIGSIGTVNVSSSGQLSLPGAGSSIALYNHGLGGTPSWFQVTLICTTSEGGYSIGDVVPLPGNDASNSHGFVPFGTSTQIGGTEGSSGIFILNKSGGGNFHITDGNWKMIIFAFR